MPDMRVLNLRFIEVAGFATERLHNCFYNCCYKFSAVSMPFVPVDKVVTFYLCVVV